MDSNQSSKNTDDGVNSGNKSIERLTSASYQVNLAILYLLHGLKLNYNLCLATEINDTDMLEDIVFSNKINYGNNGESSSHRFLQANHMQEERKQIKAGESLKKCEDIFDLLKYFLSYRKITKNGKFKGNLKQFLICSNTDILEELLKPDENEILPLTFLNRFAHDIFAHEVFLKAQFYKLTKGSTIYERLKTWLNDVLRIAAKLANIVTDKIETLPNDKLFIFYWKWICDNVLRSETTSSDNYMKFREDIVKDKNTFGQYLMILMKEMNPTMTQLDIEKAIISTNLKQKIHLGLENSSLFSYKETDNNNSPPLLVDDKEVDKFLDKIIFVVNKPDEIECENFIREEIEKDMLLRNGKLVASRVLDYIFDCAKLRKGQLMECKDGKEIFRKMEKNVAHFGIMNASLAYKSKINVNYVFEDNATIIELVKGYLHDPDKQILTIYQKHPNLSVIKVIQAIRHINLNKIIFCDFLTLKGLIESKSYPIKAFELNSSCEYLIIDFNADITANNNKDLFREFLEIVKDQKEKKIILIASFQNKLNTEKTLESLLENLEVNVSKYIAEDDDCNNLSNLVIHSQNLLLNESTVRVQDRDSICLRQIINQESELHLINGDILSQLINGDKTLKIGQEIIDSEYQKIKNYYIDRTIYRHDNTTDVTNYQMNPRGIATISDRIIIITAEEGMGKSTLLTHLATQERMDHPNGHWIVKANLVDYFEFLKCETNGIPSPGNAVQFLYKTQTPERSKVLQIHKNINFNKDGYVTISLETLDSMTDNDKFELQIFTSMYNNDQVEIMIDGLDNNYLSLEGFNLNILEPFKNTRIHRLWLACPNNAIKNELEAMLDTISYTILPFSKDQLVMLQSFNINARRRGDDALQNFCDHVGRISTSSET